MTVTVTATVTVTVTVEVDVTEMCWTPWSETTDGGVTPEHWYRAGNGTWQDSVGNTIADDDGEVVGTWEDLTANEDDVTQGTNDNRPTLQTGELNGESVLRFDGANDYLQGAFTTGGVMSQPYTIFVVAKMDASVVNDGSVHYLASCSFNTVYLATSTAPSPDEWAMFSGTLLDGSATDSNWNIWTAIFNGNSSQFWHNGTSEASGAAGSNAISNAAFSIGSGWNGGNPWKGDIAEVILYDSNLSTADKNQVAQYLAKRYALGYTDIS